MKTFTTLFLISCLFGINQGQLTVSQITGNWVDDGSNSAVSTTNCCPITGNLVVSAGTSATTQVTTTGTWGTTAGCTTNNIKSGSISAKDQTLTSSANANSFPIPFTYTYNFASGSTLAGTTNYAAAAGGNPATFPKITLNLPMNSATCTLPLTSTTNQNAVATDVTTATGQWQGPSTAVTTTGCCLPVASNTASSDSATNVKITYASGVLTLAWTWDTVSTASQNACAKQGLSGTASVAITVASPATSATLTTTTTTAVPSTDVLNSATTATWTYVANGNSCAYNLKKGSSSSSASNLYLSFAGLLLFFVAYL